MKVFDSTQEFIVLVIREGKIENLGRVFQLVRDTKEAHLLFGAEIQAYIDELYKKGTMLHAIYAMRRPGDVIRPEDVSKDAAIVEWFNQQTAVGRDKFLKISRLQGAVTCQRRIAADGAQHPRGHCDFVAC